MTQKPYQIAIDGPASSGKSSVGKLLAKKLDYLFFDTGLVYRAGTVAALGTKQNLPDTPEIIDCIRNLDFQLQNDPIRNETRIILNGTDCTDDLHLPLIDANVSIVAAIPEVRQLLTEHQRRIGQRGNVILVGRDIGTVVLPEAELKIFLVASAEVRAKRRYDENIANKIACDYESVLDSIRKRDEIDTNRAVAPLVAADDAITIDTDNLSLEDVVNAILSHIPA